MSETKLDQGIATRLSTALLIFHSGLHRRRLGDDVDRTRATLLMHLAVEVAVQALATTKDINLDKGLKKLMKAVESWVSSQASYEKFRLLRNSAQHEGVPPTPADLDEMARVGEKVLRECFAALGADFDSLTLTRWIRNSTLRSILEEAEEKARGAEYLAGANAAARAHFWLRTIAKQAAAAAHEIPTWESYDPSTDVLLRSATADGQAESTAVLLDALVTAGLGFDLAEEIRFREVIEDREPTAVNTWWAIGYVARHGWRLEDAIPSLRNVPSDAVQPTARRAAFLDATVVKRPRPPAETD